MSYIQTVQITFKVIVLLTGILLSRGLALAQCNEANDDIVVIDIEDPKNPQTHLFAVKNSSIHSIISLVIGSGRDPQLRTANFSIPIRISGPSGWKAAYSFSENSLFINWVWIVSTPESRIEPQMTMSGFYIILPSFPAKLEGQVYPDGTLVKPIIVSQLPYQITFENGGCVWGHMRALKAE